MELGIARLGKMGGNLALYSLKEDVKCVGFTFSTGSQDLESKRLAAIHELGEGTQLLLSQFVGRVLFQ